VSCVNSTQPNNATGRSSSSCSMWMRSGVMRKPNLTYPNRILIAEFPYPCCYHEPDDIEICVGDVGTNVKSRWPTYIHNGGSIEKPAIHHYVYAYRQYLQGRKCSHGFLFKSINVSKSPILVTTVSVLIC
jgi:hypothetical protein